VTLSIELTLARLLSMACAAAGLTLLIRPRRAVAALCPEFPASRIWLVRVLGARMVAQHAAVLALPEPSVARAAAAVDLAHAATMAPFVGSARYGRAARISGGLALGYAALGSVVSRRDARDREG
jgi:catechol 2,3-dioxygenase-like lactoylglutathione lyase family enzyme